MSSTAAKGFLRCNATRVTAGTVGVLLGLSGMNHGLFETLQGNVATGGLVIQAIGEAQRFWPEGTEEAFTVLPTFLLAGLASMVLGLAIVVWSLWFIQRRYGRIVFLGACVLLFLAGGGIGQLAFFLPAWAFATRMDKPLKWWRRVLPRRSRPLLSRVWLAALVLASAALLAGLEVAIFGVVPGMTEPGRIQNAGLLVVLASAILYVLSFIAGFGHDLRRLDADG